MMPNCNLGIVISLVHPVVMVLLNLIGGRGVFCRSIMKSQLASPTFTPTYAALVAIINTKFPEIGELLLKRVISQVRHICLHAGKSFARLPLTMQSPCLHVAMSVNAAAMLHHIVATPSMSEC